MTDGNPGTCGDGHAGINLNVDDTNGAFSGTLVFVACCNETPTRFYEFPSPTNRRGS